MSLNTSYVLILSYFVDNYNIHKFTYLKATYFKKLINFSTFANEYQLQ